MSGSREPVHPVRRGILGRLARTHRAPGVIDPGGSVKRKLLGLLTAAMLLSLVGAPPVNAYEPKEGALFNVPRPWGSNAEKWRLVRHVNEAIKKTRGPTAAEPNPVILISTYLLDNAQSVDAMIDACKRGVSVRVIMDADIANRHARKLITKLNGDNVKDEDGDGVPDRRARTGKCGKPRNNNNRQATAPAPLTKAQLRASLGAPTEDSITWGTDKSYAKKCNGSCRGAGGNMHTKFYAFSRTGTANNVVIVSSSNLNQGGAVLGWNDMYTIKERPKSFEAYKVIHRQMTDDDRAGDGKVEIVDGPFVSRFFPMRNAGKRRDPTLQDMNKIRCTSDIGRTQINVSMFYWAGRRGHYLADKLLSLARNGCHVSIIFGAPGTEVAAQLRAASRNHLIDLWDSRWDFNNNGEFEIRTHAKYMLVKGTFGSDRSARFVSTGSQNWVAGSLSRSDENTFNINLASAYSDYIADWNRIRAHSRRQPGT